MGGKGPDNSQLAATIRARTQQQQQNWLRQRQSEMDREATLSELHREGGYSQPSSSRQTEPGRSSSSFLGPASSSGHYSSAPRGGSPSSSSSPARSDSPGADAPRGSAYAYGLGPGPAVRHAPSVGVGGVRAEEVIDRLTERLTDRLRVELRAELELERHSAAAQEEVLNGRIEATLASEVASHTCPICYDLMVPPHNGPVLLFPCGHTFCDACLKQHTAKHVNPGKAPCPYCRQPIQSKARNVALEQIITSYATRKDRPPDVGSSVTFLGGHLRGSVSRSQAAAEAGPGSAFDADGSADTDDVDERLEYTRQLRLISMRCRILANELSDSQQEQRRLADRRSAADAVLQHLRSEATGIEERLLQLQLELEAVRGQVREQEQKVVSIEAEAEGVAAKVTLIGSTLDPLEVERTKVRLLLENIAPGSAAANGL